MKTRILVLIALIILPAVAFGAEYAKISSVDSIQVIKIAPQDKRAIIKAQDGQMRIIQAGETLQAENKAQLIPGLRVDEISTGRIVIIENKDNKVVTDIVRFENGKQWIEK